MVNLRDKPKEQQASQLAAAATQSSLLQKNKEGRANKNESREMADWLVGLSNIKT